MSTIVKTVNVVYNQHELDFISLLVKKHNEFARDNRSLEYIRQSMLNCLPEIANGSYFVSTLGFMVAAVDSHTVDNVETIYVEFMLCGNLGSGGHYFPTTVTYHSFHSDSSEDEEVISLIADEM